MLTCFRSGEKKEPKPLFNPEVDLASSVLEQLQVATDEEYQEALARDAAKSAAREVEEIIFGDATPQESANFVTVVVNPKDADNDDVIPQESIMKQSRCIQPLQRSSSLSFSDRPKLSKKKPYYRNLQDLDSEVGASTIDEQSMSANSPLGNTDLKSFTTSNDIEDDHNVPDMRSTSEDLHRNKLKKNEKAPSPFLQSIKDRLSRIPKLKLKHSLNDAATTTNDLSPAPSTVYEQNTRKIPYERTNSQLESTEQQSRPLSITNLLNLKDIELLPLNNLFSKPVKNNNLLKSEPLLSPMFEQDHGSTEIESEVDKGWKTPRLTLKNDPIEEGLIKQISRSGVVNLKRTPTEASINIDNCSNEKESVAMNSEKERNEFSEPEEVLSPKLRRDDDEFSIENDYQDPDSGTALYTEVNKSATDNSNDPESSPSLMNYQLEPKETLKINDIYDSEGVMKVLDTEIGKGEPRSTEILDTIPVINDALPKQMFVTQNDCVENKIRQNLITHATNIFSNTNDQLETRSSEIKNVESDYYKPKSIEEDDASKMTTEARPNLLDPTAIDKTISNIKSYILKTKEDLNKIKTRISLKNRNVPSQESEDNLVARYINKDSINEASVLVNAVNPTELNNNLKKFTTTKLNLADDKLEDISTNSLPNVSNENTQKTCVSNEISMQELQKLSDSILQQEEHDYSNVECDNSINDEKIESSLKNSEDTKFLDADDSASTLTQTVVEPENLDIVQDKSEEINAACKTDSTSQIDVNAQASEMYMNTISKSSETSDMHSIKKPPLDLLKNPLKDISDVLKMPSLDPLKEKFTKFFDKSDRNAQDVFPLSVKSKPLDILNPLKTTDFTAINVPEQKPLLRLSDGHKIDNLEGSRKFSVLRNTPNADPQSYKTESSVLRDLQLKPANLKYALEDSNASEKYLKVTNNLNDHLNPLNDLRGQLRDSSVEASNNIYSSLKNTHNAVESKLRQLKNNDMSMLKTPIKSSSTFLDHLTQNHEDMTDKLRALHMDFNDRVESMRNDLIDSSKRLTSGYRGAKPSLKSATIFDKPDYENINHKLRALHMDISDKIESMRNDIFDRPKPFSDGWRGTKSNFRSSSNFKKQNKPNIPLKKSWQSSNRREPSLPFTRKHTPLRASSSSKILEQKKLRMTAAASVPVPRTVQVPELKTTSSKLPPTLRKASPLNPNNKKNLNEDVSRGIGAQINNVQLPNTLRNRINLKKENTVTVSFSTTPRPEKITIPSFRSIIPQSSVNSRTNFEAGPNYTDRNGSPSMLRNLKTSVPNYNQPNIYRYQNTEVNDERLTNSIELKQKSQPKTSKPALQSWPKATESAFLSKVKGAVRERLSYLNSAKALKQRMPGDKPKNIRELSVLNSDMARSASENEEIVLHDTLFKENISYNCKLVCTKN